MKINMTNKAQHFLVPAEKHGVQTFIDKVRKAFGDNIVEMIIFGSKITGDFDAESDIDILILVKKKTWEIRDKICEIANEIDLQYQANISPIILTDHEFEKNKIHKTRFSKNVLTLGVPV